MRKLLAPAVLIGALALAGCSSGSDEKAVAPQSASATTSAPATTKAAEPEPTELLDGIAEADKAADVSYEDNGYDTAMPAIEVHGDKNSGVTFDGLDIELKAAEQIPVDQVTGITDSYEGYDGLLPIRLTFTVSNNLEGAGPFPLEDPGVTGFYGENLQPVEQYTAYQDNDGGPELDSDDPRQVAEGSDTELVRTLWIPEDAEGEDLMAEILLRPDYFYVDYFIPGDQITDLN